MSIRLKKLLALSLSISLAATGIITDVGENSIFAAAASKTTEVKVKKVQITVAQKKTIKAPKSEKKAVWSIVSGQQNISVIKKGKGEIKIKAQKSGSVKLQAKQGKKKTTYDITVKKQAPKKSEVKQLRKLYIDCFWKAQEESPYDWGWRKNSDVTKLKWFSDWVSWDDYGYVKGIVLDSMSITTPYFIGYDIEPDVKLPTFKKIQYFGSVTGNGLKSVDLGNNPTLKYFFLKQGYGEYWDEQEYAELKEINRIVIEMHDENPSIDGETLDDYGLVHLTGTQATAFSRIRKIDSDNERANRQQKVLMALFDKCKNMPKTDYPGFIKELLPLVKTSLDYGDIIGLAPIMLTSNLTIEQNMIPDEQIDNPIGGTYNGAWVWRYDLDEAADRLHEFIYEDSLDALTGSSSDADDNDN